MAEGTRMSRMETTTKENANAINEFKGVHIELRGQIAALTDMVRELLANRESSNQEGHYHNRQETRYRGPIGVRVEIPMFDGDGVEEWIFKTQQYFELYPLAEDQRIRTVSFHFHGAAYSWYRWIVNNRVQQTWEQFLQGLRLRFGANLYHDPRTALKELKQTTSVGEYQSQFEELSNQVTGLMEQWLVSFFIAGLNDHLKYDMLLAQPVTYASAVSMAKIYEQKQLYMQQLGRPPENRSTGSSVGKATNNSTGQTRYHHPNQNAWTSNHSANNTTVPSPSAPNHPASNTSATTSIGSSNKTPYRRLSTQEIRSRRERGLCYHCDEKYSPGHRCKVSCLLLIGEEEWDELRRA